MTPKSRATATPGWVLLACIGLIALNMRGPFVAVASVLGPLNLELSFSPMELGLLTGIPVLCFSLASPLASWAGRKLGAEFAITLTLLGVLAGVVIRSSSGAGTVLLGTVIIGVAITIGNIAVPLIIRRDFPPLRQNTALGVYTAALNIGSFLTSVATAPLANLLGWRLALASTGVLAMTAAVVWAGVAGRRAALLPAPLPTHSKVTAPGKRDSVWVTVGLTAGFAGQAFSYYGVTAWLPSYLIDELSMTPTSAGAGSSIFQILAIVGGLGVPLAARFICTRSVAMALGLLWLTVPVGLLLSPELWWLWSGFGGIAQGGGITVIFIAVIQRSSDQVSAGRMSATVQGIGYCFAAIAPTVVGYVHGASGSWNTPLLVILVSVAVFIGGTIPAVGKAKQQN